VVAVDADRRLRSMVPSAGALGIAGSHVHGDRLDLARSLRPSSSKNSSAAAWPLPLVPHTTQPR
jgi:hypothetical protein